jgi:hypothetical protein
LNTEPPFNHADNMDGGKISLDVAGRYAKFVPVTPHGKPILACGAQVKCALREFCVNQLSTVVRS